MRTGRCAGAAFCEKGGIVCARFVRFSVFSDNLLKKSGKTLDFSDNLWYTITVIKMYADLAHLVERDLAKVEVAGSIPVIRSKHGYESNQFVPVIIRRRSQAVRQRSAKPSFPGPIPGDASKCSGLKRCRSKNPRFSRVFFVFLRFPRFFKIRLKTKTKRCQIPISTFLPESDWRTTISGRFSERFSLRKPPFFRFLQKK